MNYPIGINFKKHYSELVYKFQNNIEMYNIEILYDLSMTFMTKLFTKNAFSSTHLRFKLIDEYIDFINNYQKLDSYHYHMFNDFCDEPIKELNKIYDILKPKQNNIILSSMYLNLEKNEYIEMIHDNIPCFIPMNNVIDEVYINNYMKNKIYNINDIRFTDYDIIYFKQHLLPRYELSYINELLTYFYERIKDSNINQIINSKEPHVIMDVLTYINNFDIAEIKTNILEQIKHRERRR